MTTINPTVKMASPTSARASQCAPTVAAGLTECSARAALQSPVRLADRFLSGSRGAIASGVSPACWRWSPSVGAVAMTEGTCCSCGGLASTPVGTSGSTCSGSGFGSSFFRRVFDRQWQVGCRVSDRSGPAHDFDRLSRWLISTVLSTGMGAADMLGAS